jgi:phosphate transport system ATP-binding protein
VTIVIVTRNMQQAKRVSQKCVFFLAEGISRGTSSSPVRRPTCSTTRSIRRTAGDVYGRFG